MNTTRGKIIEILKAENGNSLKFGTKPVLPLVSSAVLMPCGSNHNCHHCNGYYFGCTWLERMTEEEYEKHEQLVIATR